MQPLHPPRTPSTGLILTGGGARAAYQVGVLQAIAQLRREAGLSGGNPFPIIAGTSAGAINAATLACEADDFGAAVGGLMRIWRNLHAEQVYTADALGVIRSGARWLTMMSLGWALARWRRSRPKSLLDNAPLAELLRRSVRFERMDAMLQQGHLEALAISGSSYSSGQHVTFYQARGRLDPWQRSQRLAVRAPLSVEHLMASSAIPFIFPAVPLQLGSRPEWFGDGSMRQSAPISPAVHLGAERVLVIGAGRMHEPPGRRETPEAGGPPSLAQIAGHAMSNIFLDALAVDIERLQRINSTLALLTPEARRATPLRPIEVLVIAPSRRLDELAAEHQASLPTPVRALLRGVGVSGEGRQASGSALASYLLFEPSYTRELIRLGIADTLARRAEVLRFFGWRAEPTAAQPRLTEA
ncbi:patatin-like phospholipase family protein [Roseateles violae]|uniref:Patatin-like phospholipase family protein n=1 Tax=Roseateles violae TaxID=3058042 RepID=A0ABT8DPC1_9BURK|nr:patatin-like phospholipase family protein [Pelomonas sp. PFR6]MDN3920185.1 patatin-like phospholipase family protein [Pelomonas sp. PFR6]